MIEVRIENIQDALIESDAAKLYGVETKRITEAARNNPERFPDSFILEVFDEQFGILRSKFSTAKYIKTRTNPKAATEKGLYVLATVSKSRQAIQTTLATVETFAKLRELSKNIQETSNTKDEQHQQTLMQKSGTIIANVLDQDLQTSEAETTIELNFAVLKVKHTIKKNNK